MFDFSSRYFNLETTTYTMADGRQVSYKRRRFLPQGESLPLLVEVRIARGDRLDLLSAKALGDPLQFWRIADANNAMQPAALTAEPGAAVRVPVPQAQG
jgi:nucleoid-associated protein YgaU